MWCFNNTGDVGEVIKDDGNDDDDDDDVVDDDVVDDDVVDFVPGARAVDFRQEDDGLVGGVTFELFISDVVGGTFLVPVDVVVVVVVVVVVDVFSTTADMGAAAVVGGLPRCVLMCFFR